MIVANRPFGFGGKVTTENGGNPRMHSRTMLRVLQLAAVLCCCAPGIATLSDSQYEELRAERAEAAKEWAPLVYLHPKETIFPTAVHTFLKHVVPKTVKKTLGETDPPALVPISRSLNTQVLPEGPSSKDSYLVAPIDPECGNCALPVFLFGDKPTAAYAPPVYAVITSCLPPRGKKPIDRSSKYEPNSSKQKRPRLGKRIKDSILRAGSHLRSRYLARRNRKNTQRRLGDVKEAKVIEITSKKKKSPPKSPLISRKDTSTEDIPSTTDKEASTTSTLSGGNDSESPPNDAVRVAGIPPKIDRDDTPSRRLVEQELSYYGDNINLIDSDLDAVDGSEALAYNYNDSHIMDLFALNENWKQRGFAPYPAAVTTTPYSGGDTTPDSAADQLTLGRPPYEVTQVPAPSQPSPPSRIERKRDYDTHPHWKNKKARKGHHFTVTYWMFYPFSRGKSICTSNLWLLGRVFKPRIRNKCFGDEVTVNDHVGDWEHISIFFEDGLPERMYISSHYFGSFYKYNHKTNTFDYVGKDTRNALPLTAKFPSVVKIKGTHPVVFSALGSHGLWGGPGNHRYLNFIKLTDETETGTPWKTWKNIDIIDYRDSYLKRPDRQWLKFQGRWGNPSYGCHKGLFGICYLTKGPTGIPEKRENFPCHKPDDPTFKPKP